MFESVYVVLKYILMYNLKKIRTVSKYRNISKSVFNLSIPCISSSYIYIHNLYFKETFHEKIIYVKHNPNNRNCL